MALKLGELVAFLRVDKGDFDKGLVEAKAQFHAAGADMDREADQTGKQMGEKLGQGGTTGAETFARTGTARMRDSRGRFIREGEDLGADTGKAAGDKLSEKLGEALDQRGSGSGISGFFSKIASAWRSSGGQLETEIEKTKTKIRELAEEADKTGNKSLLGDISKHKSDLKSLQSAAVELGTGGFDTARQAMGNFGTVATNVLSNVWNLIPAILAIAGAATFAGPAVGLLGGALGSLPALAVGGGAVLGVLGLGTMGLSEAFKTASGAGAAMVDTAHQVMMAERGIADAQRNALAAQENVNKARQDAAKNIDDLTRSLKDANLQEEGAAMAEADAQKALLAAKATGTLDQIKHADFAYRQSVQTLEDVRAKTADTAVQQAKAAAAGVEGSDQVKSALEQQRKAVVAVEDAQYNLQQTLRSQAQAGAAAAAATTVLAASAQHLVDVIKSLKPAFEDLRLDIQQRLFAGVGDEVKSLASAWLPTLHTKLGAFADTFNGLFKNFAEHAKQPEFIDNIGKGLDSVNTLLDKVGTAASGPLVDAFGRLSAAAKPFLDAMGDEVAKLLTDFSNWIKKADESGALKDFFKKAGEFLRDVFDMGRDVGSILGSIADIAFGKEKSGKETPWEQLKRTLDDLAAWFKNPENKKKVEDWLNTLQDVGKGVLVVSGAIGGLIVWLDKANRKIFEWAADSGKSMGDFADWTGHKLDQLGGWFEALPGRISNAAWGMWDGVKDSFRSAVNWIIGKWNGLSFTIGGGSFAGMPIPSTSLSVPRIPYLADGGVVRATPGGRTVQVAEGGQDEAVMPLDKLAAMLGGRGQQITVKFDTGGDAVLGALFQQMRYKVRSDYDGDLNQALVGV